MAPLKDCFNGATRDLLFLIVLLRPPAFFESSAPHFSFGFGFLFFAKHAWGFIELSFLYFLHYSVAFALSFEPANCFFDRFTFANSNIDHY
jgi:hypothetical protein